jgi:hypothetical protein
MSPNLFDSFSLLLGAASDDARLIQELQQLDILRRPMIPDFFKSPYEVPLRLSKHGLMLSFQDANYFHNTPAHQSGLGGLLLRSVVAIADIEPSGLTYSGQLPFGLVWGDAHPVVRAKMTAAAAVAGDLHGGWRDCWWKNDRYFSVTYTAGAHSIDGQEGMSEIVCGLFTPASQPNHGLQACDYPAPGVIIKCFGQPGRSPSFQLCFEKFRPTSWKWDTHIDLSQRFDESKLGLDGDPVFVGVNLKRDRLGPSTAWLGQLPFDFHWDNSIDDVVKLIGRQPDEQELDFEVWGWAKWFLADHLLWINFDTVRNRLESIALMDLTYEKSR